MLNKWHEVALLFIAWSSERAATNTWIGIEQWTKSTCIKSKNGWAICYAEAITQCRSACICYSDCVSMRLCVKDCFSSWWWNLLVCVSSTWWWTNGNTLLLCSPERLVTYRPGEIESVMVCVLVKVRDISNCWGNIGYVAAWYDCGGCRVLVSSMRLRNVWRSQ